MNWADFAILAVIVLSAIIGFFRGFMREVIGLATWVLAFYVAFSSAATAAIWLKRWIASGSIRVAVAFAVIFVVVLILGAIVNYALGRLVSKTGFAGTDRTLGGLFGVVRGAAVLVLLVLLAGATSLPGDAWWQKSVFIGHLQDGAIRVRSWLPDRFADAIIFPAETAEVDGPPAPQALPAEQQRTTTSSS